MTEVPLGRVAMGRRNELRVVWRPDGDDRGVVPVLELARYRLTDGGEWIHLGTTSLRATCDLRELSQAIDVGARFAKRWQQEHPGER